MYNTWFRNRGKDFSKKTLLLLLIIILLFLLLLLLLVVVVVVVVVVAEKYILQLLYLNISASCLIDSPMDLCPILFFGGVDLKNTE